MSVPQWNADIITPDAPASDTPIATNGGLEKNQSGELGVSVDGSTVTINGDGQLEAAGGGGGGSEYSAGAGIAIDGNGAISVVPDSTTIKVERPLAVYATKDSFYGRMSFSDTLLGTATPGSTCTFSYGLNTNGAAFKIGCDSDQVGCEIRVEIGNDSNFTKSVISTVSMAKSSQSGVLVTLTDTDTILEGYGLSFYRGMGSPTYTFSNTFDWSEYTFDEIFGNASIYVRLRAWDSGNNVVVGNVLGNPTSTGTQTYVSANMSINSDAIPQQVMVKFGNASYSGLTTNNYGLAVKNPLPSSLGTAGQVLTVNSGATGVEWATPSGGGAGVEYVTRSTPFEDVLAAYQAGKLPVLEYDVGGTKYFYVMTKYDPSNGHYLYRGVFLFTQWTGSSTNGYTYVLAGQLGVGMYTCYRDGSGVTQWSSSTSYILPEYGNGDAGKVLQVQNGGTLAWVTLT